MTDRSGAEVAPFTNAAKEDVLEARIAKLEEQVDHVDNPESGRAAYFASAQGRLGTVEARLDRVEEGLSRLEKVVADVVTALSPKSCNSDKAEALEAAAQSMAVGK